MVVSSNKETLLEVKEIEAGYGDLTILKDINLLIRRGEIVALLGPNGAGKSTLMYAIMGLAVIKKGLIKFDGQTINGLPTEQIVKLGLTLVPEGKLLFSTLSVWDNLLVGSYPLLGKKRRDKVREGFAITGNLFPILQKRKSLQAGMLSGGEQQMLAVARGIMSSPRLVLLDEPCLGLAPLLVKEVMRCINKLREEQGINFLISEQNARATLEIVDRGYVLSRGRIVMEGSVQELKSTEAIRAAYLGY